MQIVWFKRDLRTYDHRPLVEAARRGRVLPLYVCETDLWREADMSARQWAFVCDCLEELSDALRYLGQPLIVRRGDIISVLQELHDKHPIEGLWSHEETGNGWTFARDKRVAAWCRGAGIPWQEYPQHGVQRRLASRDGWAKDWDSFMGLPALEAPILQPLCDLKTEPIPTACDLKLAPDPCPERQKGGREAGLDHLSSFLTRRGERYRSAMSTPREGASACSRLSPYLAYGALSMREVAQQTWARQRQIKQDQSLFKGTWRGALASFSGRLHWHCHFMQKLEDEPRLEFDNLHPAYDGLRPSEPDLSRLEAWQRGETGLPFVDACMRMLIASGWMNFRMRAMLMAVASYHLWLPWRASGLHLARLFTDYEPGIHWPQVQMQSGTTGINTIRIYNPVKQGYDQDRDGVFVRQWLPELSEIDDAFLDEPWKAPNAGAVLDKIYPFPIVDHLAAAKEARQKIWSVRGGQAFRETASAIQTKHGSRKSGVPLRGGRRNTKPAQDEDQLTLFASDAPRKLFP